MTEPASAKTICSMPCVDLAPARRFLERRGGAGPVAHVGDRDLHGIFVHLDVLVAEDFGANDGVLDEILGHAAADHEQAGGARRDLDVGQFAEVGDGVDHHVRLAGLGRSTWCLTRPKPAERIDERRAEDRHVMFVGKLDEAVFLLAMLGQILAHLADESARWNRPRLQLVRDLVDRVVAVLQLLFVDIGVVDAVDVERAQRVVVGHFERLVVLVAKAFEEIHVDDGRAGRDDASIMLLRSNSA
jgi:hypothetical protein